MERLLLHFVYGLTDPRFDGVAAVRYIGITMHPNVRYETHLRCLSSDPPEKNAWIQDVYAAGFEPGIMIFEVFKATRDNKSLRSEKENQWIRHYKSLGANLINTQGNKDVELDDIELPDALIDWLRTIGEPD